MRTLPASHFKSGKQKPPLTEELKPRPGGLARAMFDFFLEHKGVPIKTKYLSETFGKNSSLRIIDLNDFWGLDIRSIPDCHHKCLVGEWFGDEYKDYVAEKLSG